MDLVTAVAKRLTCAALRGVGRRKFNVNRGVGEVGGACSSRSDPAKGPAGLTGANWRSACQVNSAVLLANPDRFTRPWRIHYAVRKAVAPAARLN